MNHTHNIVPPPGMHPNPALPNMQFAGYPQTQPPNPQHHQHQKSNNNYGTLLTAPTGGDLTRKSPWQMAHATIAGQVSSSGYSNSFTSSDTLSAIFNCICSGTSTSLPELQKQLSGYASSRMNLIPDFPLTVTAPSMSPTGEIDYFSYNGRSGITVPNSIEHQKKWLMSLCWSHHEVSFIPIQTGFSYFVESYDHVADYIIDLAQEWKQYSTKNTPGTAANTIDSCNTTNKINIAKATITGTYYKRLDNNNIYRITGHKSNAFVVPNTKWRLGGSGFPGTETNTRGHVTFSVPNPPTFVKEYKTRTSPPKNQLYITHVWDAAAKSWKFFGAFLAPEDILLLVDIPWARDAKQADTLYIENMKSYGGAEGVHSGQISPNSTPNGPIPPGPRHSVSTPSHSLSRTMSTNSVRSGSVVNTPTHFGTPGMSAPLQYHSNTSTPGGVMPIQYRHSHVGNFMPYMGGGSGSSSVVGTPTQYGPIAPLPQPVMPTGLHSRQNSVVYSAVQPGPQLQQPQQQVSQVPGYPYQYPHYTTSPLPHVSQQHIQQQQHQHHHNQQQAPHQQQPFNPNYPNQSLNSLLGPVLGPNFNTSNAGRVPVMTLTEATPENSLLMNVSLMTRQEFKDLSKQAVMRSMSKRQSSVVAGQHNAMGINAENSEVSSDLDSDGNMNENEYEQDEYEEEEYEYDDVGDEIEGEDMEELEGEDEDEEEKEEEEEDNDNDETHSSHLGSASETSFLAKPYLKYSQDTPRLRGGAEESGLPTYSEAASEEDSYDDDPDGDGLYDDTDDDTDDDNVFFHRFNENGPNESEIKDTNKKHATGIEIKPDDKHSKSSTGDQIPADLDLYYSSYGPLSRRLSEILNVKKKNTNNDPSEASISNPLPGDFSKPSSNTNVVSFDITDDDDDDDEVLQVKPRNLKKSDSLNVSDIQNDEKNRRLAHQQDTFLIHNPSKQQPEEKMKIISPNYCDFDKNALDNYDLNPGNSPVASKSSKKLWVMNKSPINWINATEFEAVCAKNNWLENDPTIIQDDTKNRQISSFKPTVPYSDVLGLLPQNSSENKYESMFSAISGSSISESGRNENASEPFNINQDMSAEQNNDADNGDNIKQAGFRLQVDIPGSLPSPSTKSLNTNTKESTQREEVVVGAENENNTGPRNSFFGDINRLFSQFHLHTRSPEQTPPQNPDPNTDTNTNIYMNNNPNQGQLFNKLSDGQVQSTTLTIPTLQTQRDLQALSEQNTQQSLESDSSIHNQQQTDFFVQKLAQLTTQLASKSSDTVDPKSTHTVDPETSKSSRPIVHSHVKTSLASLYSLARSQGIDLTDFMTLAVEAVSEVEKHSK